MVSRNKVFYLLILFTCNSVYGFCQDTVQRVMPNRKNSLEQQQKPYVILISADGFRWDYADKYHAANLIRFREQGISAASMLPSYPSVTFPNHYAMVTGLYPSHSGLVNNTFYDRGRKDFYKMGNKLKVADSSWYGGTPLWVLAEQQQMVSANFYWVASEAAIKGVRSTYYYIYNEQINISRRIATVVNWLKLPPDARPHLITFYFPEADHAGHVYGPDAPETAQQVQHIDSAVNELYKAVKTTGLDVNFIFVSDHGMTKADIKDPIGIPAAIDTSRFIVSGDGILVELYARDKQYIQGTYNDLKNEARGYQVYTKENIPAKLHYGTADDWHNRIGDILLIPQWPRIFNLYNSKKINPGWHGFDPSVVKDMHATFYAWGPAFKKHLSIPVFENVDVYNLVSRILGLKSSEKIDGSNKLADKVLIR